MSLFPFSQPVYKLRVALDIKGFIVRVDHLSRQRPDGFFTKRSIV